MIGRITFRPGYLAEPLAAYCERHGLTPSEGVRLAVAAMLGQTTPPMDGRRKHIARVNAARAKRAKRKGRK